ncbi:hypothetical protein MKX01_012367 [Papaver californicum]|nr:hypothetical protein MKX01_012367 [Papaver californicum]
MGYYGSTSNEIVEISSTDVHNLLTDGGNNSKNQQIGEKTDEYVTHVSTEIEELVANSINKKFESGTTTSRRWGQCCIHKVHEKFHKISEHAYVPSIVSICPFHHGKDSLKAMEECKLSYTDRLASETRERSIALKQCISVIKNMERHIRESYSDPIDLNGEEFVEMMVVDGLFIIELLTRRFMYVYTQNDPLRNNLWLKSSLKWDLLLVENQLPILVNALRCSFLLCSKYSLLLPDGNTLLQTHPNCRHARHFLDLIAIVLHPTPHRRVLEELHPTSGKVEQTMRLKHHVVQSIIGLYSSCRLFTTIMISGLKHAAAHIFTKGTATSTHPHANNKKDARSIMKFTPSATELNRAGVKFKRGSADNGFYDIKFSRGVLEIPLILIQDQTELLFRNLIACERFSDARGAYMSSYAIFTNKLITSAEDVELLRSNDIIRNSFGSDENVANLFNKLISSEINPWTIISFAAALLLIILTIMAALFAQLSFFVHKS